MSGDAWARCLAHDRESGAQWQEQAFVGTVLCILRAAHGPHVTLTRLPTVTFAMPDGEYGVPAWLQQQALLAQHALGARVYDFPASVRIDPRCPPGQVVFMDGELVTGSIGETVSSV